MRSLSIKKESWPIDGSFTISRGSRTYAEVVTVEVKEGEFLGWGECVPYARYGETCESVIAQIESLRGDLEEGLSKQALQSAIPAGAARNAIDCALWDLEAKLNRNSVIKETINYFSKPLSSDLVTAYTISLGSADEMAFQTKVNADRKLLKIKLGGSGDIERMKAVRNAAPNARLILDANEAWSGDMLVEYLNVAAEINADVVEQPLPAGQDQALAKLKRAVPVCADESVHTSEGLAELKDRYDCVNIKLDKTGGLTEALKMHQEARKIGFSIMVGCMVGTSLAMAPALILAQDSEFIDLDGPLLLSKDRDDGLVYQGSNVSLPTPQLWG